MKRLLVVIAAGALSLALGLPASADGGGGARFLYAPDASPRGKTLAEWQAAYQIWANEIPTSINPRTDPSSSLNCAPQDHKVVFLGGFGADCTIPKGAAIAFTPALAFWECSTAEGLGDTFAELRACAKANFARDLGNDVYHQRIWIDGKKVKHQRRWIVVTRGEIIDFPDPNIWNGVPGPTKSVTKGFMFVLHPLCRGTHQIKWVLHHDVFGDFSAVWNLTVA